MPARVSRHAVRRLRRCFFRYVVTLKPALPRHCADVDAAACREDTTLRFVARRRSNCRGADYTPVHRRQRGSASSVH